MPLAIFFLAKKQSALCFVTHFYISKHIAYLIWVSLTVFLWATHTISRHCFLLKGEYFGRIRPQSRWNMATFLGSKSAYDKCCKSLFTMRNWIIECRSWPIISDWGYDVIYGVSPTFPTKVTLRLISFWISFYRWLFTG